MTAWSRVDRARLYTLPAEPPPLIGAAVSEATAQIVGSWADGLITVNQRPEVLRRVLDAFDAGGGAGKPRYLQVHVSWADSDDEAVAIAHDQWRTNVFVPRSAGTWKRRATSTRCPATSARGHARLRVDLIGSDALLDRLAELVGSGSTASGSTTSARQQDRFIDTFGEHVVPTLRTVGQ